MSNNSGGTSTPEVRFTPEFKRNLRQFAKKYRSIRSDIQPVIELLTQGSLPGDQIPGMTVAIYKVRVRNSDAQRGKSGYRIIYYLRGVTSIVLITIYSKTEQQDIDIQDIQAILQEDVQTGDGEIPETRM